MASQAALQYLPSVTVQLHTGCAHFCPFGDIQISFKRRFHGGRATYSLYRRRFERTFLAETVATRLTRLTCRMARLFNAFRFRRTVFGALLILAAIVPNAEPMVRATATSVSLSLL